VGPVDLESDGKADTETRYMVAQKLKKQCNAGTNVSNQKERTGTASAVTRKSDPEALQKPSKAATRASAK
jgi:hypothetical protein